MKRPNMLVRLIALTSSMLFVGATTITFSTRPQSFNAVLAKAPTHTPSEQELLKESIEKMPLSFIENSGQLDKKVAYYVQGRDKMLYFTPQGVTIVLTNMALSQGQATAPARWILKLEFLGANPQVKITGKEQTEAMFSYFAGSLDQWKSGLKAYKSIVYQDLWPGIDLVYSGPAKQMNYEFIVKPGANPEQIRLAYRGASALKLAATGSLEITTPLTGLADDKPVSYQEINGQRVEIPTAYALDKKSNEHRFLFGTYERSYPLVIAPAMREAPRDHYNKAAIAVPR